MQENLRIWGSSCYASSNVSQGGHRSRCSDPGEAETPDHFSEGQVETRDRVIISIAR